MSEEEQVTLLHGDCLEILRTLESDSVDALVTDPPAGIGFMGKDWDHHKGGRDQWVAWMREVMTEALRVLKPGAHGLVWAIPRTSHWTGTALEDAGFEVRDRIAHVFGSGFPKSMDVSKAIDKRGGAVAGFEQFRDAVRAAMQRNGVSRAELTKALGNHMLSHYLTAGSQPAVPNVKDYRTIRDTLGLGHDWDHLFAEEAEREVVGFQHRGTSVNTDFMSGGNSITAPATEAAKQWQGWGTALKPAMEDWWLVRKPFPGTVAANVLKYGTGAINVDGCRVGVDGGTTRSEQAPYAESGWLTGHDVIRLNAGRWPAHLIHDGSEEVVGLFPVTKSGALNRASITAENGIYGKAPKERKGEYASDSGSAARFFYCAKASKADRDEGCEGLEYRTAGEMVDREEGSAGINNPRAGAGRTGGARNHHPTVKPVSLMRYLCRLVTPPGGIVLDPFMGSGSTGKGAILEGFRFIGIEREAEYLEIAKARIAYAIANYAPPEDKPAQLNLLPE